MKILLSSVFGPYGVDDAYGRKENIMELFHNQVTREQGPLSLRFHHHSFGLYFIAENIHAPSVVLDFPSQQRFIEEIKKGYDYIGISFIVPNFLKAQRMAELVRKHAPDSQIVLGGHGTMIPGIEQTIEHDHICRGEGVKWFRQLLGENPDRPFKHPHVPSTARKRVLGVPLKAEAAVLIPGVGCPNGCRFCSTSHLFDKKYTPYFESGRELFDACVEIEHATGFTEFFVMDENFLKHTARAREFLRLMQEANKLYNFSIFSSAETIAEVGVEFLARLGVNFVWIGVESKHEIYEKNEGIDLKAMIRSLRDHGISVLASGILFLEQHDKKTIWDDIKFVVDLESDFVQFMQLGPLPGTTLYEDYDSKGLLRKDVPYEEWHGQHHIWFRHPHFTPEESDSYLRDAFRYDYDMQGASLLRVCDTAIRGVETLARYNDPWMRKRREQLRVVAGHQYRPVLGALKKHSHNARARHLTEGVIAKYDQAFGAMSLKQWISSKVIHVCAQREVSRHASGRDLCQPRSMQTKWRMSLKDLVADRMKGKTLTNILHLRIDWSSSPLSLNLGGVLDKVNSRDLVRKITRYMKDEDGELILILDRLVAIEDEALAQLLKEIRKYHDRVEIVFKAHGDAVREAIANLPEDLAVLFIERRPVPA